MKIIGIVAEFNPFHNGHEYLIEQAKKTYHADYIVVAMSGDFVQRGEPAIFPKHVRAQFALEAGADLILEIPVAAATGSAEFFAGTSVEMLARSAVTHLCFGCEHTDLKLLKEIATILFEEPACYKEVLTKNLKNGASFPKAREHAICACFRGMKRDEGDKLQRISDVLHYPNNILALEYIKSILKLKEKGFDIEPVPIQRIGSGYHDTALVKTTSLQKGYSSASAIRKAISDYTDCFDFNQCLRHMPEGTVAVLKGVFGKRGPVYYDDCSLLFKYRLMNLSATDLEQYLDVSSDLAHKIKKYENEFITMTQYCQILKSADVTLTRIQRVLLHILLGIKKEDIRECSEEYYVLGFKKSSTALLTFIKEMGNCTLVSKLAGRKWEKESGERMGKSIISASNLYESLITDKYKTNFIHELKKETVRL